MITLATCGTGVGEGKKQDRIYSAVQKESTWEMHWEPDETCSKYYNK